MRGRSSLKGKSCANKSRIKLAFKLPSAASFINKGRTGGLSKKLIHTKYSLKSEQSIYKSITRIETALGSKLVSIAH